MKKKTEIKITKQQMIELKKWEDKNYCIEAVKRNGDAYIYISKKIYSKL